jgi:gliding motility-associated-like protein
MRHFLLLFFLLFTLNIYTQSLHLTTFGSWVNVGDLDIPSNNITVEAFVFITGDLSRDSLDIVSKHGAPTDANYLLRPNSFEITTYKNGNSGATQFSKLGIIYPFVKSRWYHIAGTYDGATMRFYVNGCLLGEKTTSGNLFQNNFNTSIGMMGKTTIEQFYGDIDEVKIWSIARTETQIKDNMANLPTPTIQNGLQLYYKFNGNAINLQGNNAYNGQIKGRATLNVNEPTLKLPIVNTVLVQQPCGQRAGFIELVAPSNMVFSLNQNPFSTVSNFPNLDTGRYIVRTKPDEWCFLREDTFQLTDFKIKETLVKNAVCGQAKGEITLKTNDDANTQFSTDSLNYVPNSTFKNLKPNTYKLFAKNSGGCNISINALVKDSSTLSSTLDLQVKNEKCNQENGSITASITGKGTIEFSLDSVQFSVKNQFSNLKKGTYQVYVRNNDGCKAKGSTTIQNEETSYLSIEKIETQPASCGLPNGTISIQIKGNTEGVRYALDRTQFTNINNFTKLKEGDYQVFIRDTNKCLIMGNTLVGTKKSDTLQFSLNVNPSVCNGKTGGFVIGNVKNGVPPFQFSLNDSVDFKSDLSYTNLVGAQYMLYAKDSLGCSTARKEILIPRVNCEVYVPTIFSPNEDNSNDVFKIYADEGLIKTIKSYQIFNRWGNQVYVSPQQNTDFASFNSWWDGTFQGNKAPSDVYIYVIEVEYTEGLNKYRDRVLKGDVMVMR